MFITEPCSEELRNYHKSISYVFKLISSEKCFCANRLTLVLYKPFKYFLLTQSACLSFMCQTEHPQQTCTREIYFAKIQNSKVINFITSLHVSLLLTCCIIFTAYGIKR